MDGYGFREPAAGASDEVPVSSWDGATADELRDRWRIPALRLYLRVGSTNDVAADLAAAGHPDGTVVLADSQTRGRGRDGRSWHAPAGAAVLMSIVRRVPHDPEALGAAPLRVGLGVAAAIERTAGIVTRIKWPNDVLDASGRKLAGVLCESSLSSSGGTMIVGIGINVGQRPADFPADVRDGAASLRIAGAAVQRADLVAALLEELQRLTTRDRLVRPMDPAELDELRNRDHLAGRRIEVGGRTATALGVAPDGALRARLTDGSELRVLAGAVRLIDPATNVSGRSRGAS